MSSRTIPLMPAALERGKSEFMEYCKGAWSFASTVLWSEQQFKEKELEMTRVWIQTYFENAVDPKKAFIAFCERVILTSRYINAEPGRYVPSPSVWFNKDYPHGFPGTKLWYYQIKQKRLTVPGYLQHISTLAEYYAKYVINPTKQNFITGRKKLLEQNGNSLLLFFYKSILHFNYIKN